MQIHTGRTAIVGRERELGFLLDRLHLAGRGEAGVVLVSGEPGIGKTRLLETLAERAREDGWLVLAGRAYDLEGMPPYVPFVEALRGYVRASPTEELAGQLGDAAAIVGRMLPQVRERLGEMSPETTLLPGDDRYRLFAGVADFLLAIAGSAEASGLLVVLDDLHWADQSSLLLLRYLASALRDGRILLAGACRTVELGAAHPLHDLLAELEREGVSERLTLGPLLPEATEALIAQLGGQAAAPVAKRIHRIADGNPFFVTQVVRHLVGTGRNLGDPSVAEAVWETPEGVREVIGRRVGRLRPESRSVLEMGAVLGERFGYDVLAEALGADAATTAAGIAEAADAGLVREAGDGYQFAHALIRQTLYEGMTLPRRRRLHLAAAEAIERLAAHDLAAHAAELAAHYQLAGVAAEPAKRLRWSREAAEAAMRMFAWEEAEGHLSTAVSLVYAGDETERYALLLRLGEAQAHAGRLSQTEATLRMAAQAARMLGSAEKLAHAALGFPLTFTFAGDLLDRRIEQLQEALDALGSDDDPLRARLLGALATAVRYKGNNRQAEHLSSQAVDLARRCGTPTDMAFVLYHRAAVFWQPGKARERYTAATEVLELARRLGDDELALLAHRLRLTSSIELGDLAAAVADEEAFGQIIGGRRQPLYHWFELIRLGLRALLAGDFVAARALIAETRDLGRRLGGPDWTGWQEVTLLREFGQFDAIEPVVRQRLVDDGRPLHWRCVLARSLVEMGRVAEAREEFHHLVDDELENIPQDNPWYVSIGLLAEACATLGDRNRAATLYQVLLPYADVTISMFGQVVCHGSAERFLGLLAATMGRWEDAGRHFEVALERNSRMNARPWVAHTLHDHAAMVIARGGRGATNEARSLLERAASLYDELGMNVWAAQARELLPAAGDSARRAPAGLTAREVEVLQMIAAGRSNREIAGELVLSIRTVEKHIETIYSKIGAHGQAARAAAATYAVRRGLASSDAPAPQ